MTIRSCRRQISYTPREDLDELAARHHAVVQVVVGGDLRHRAERRLAALPQQRALGVVGGHADRAHAVRVRCGLDLGASARPRPPACPSTSTIRIARRRRSGNRRARTLSAATTMPWSIISTAAGTTPRAMMSVTVAAQSSTVVKSSSIVRTAAGSGVSRTHDSGHDPERPLAAHDHAAKVVAGGLGRLGADPDDLPSGSTTSRASTCALVTPYARQCGPPAFVLTLPPIEEVCWLDGSGAYVYPSGRSATRQVEVRHARLDPREAILRADLERRASSSPSRRRARRRSAWRRRPAPCRIRAARREAVIAGGAHARDDVLGRAGERDELARALDHRSVAGVEPPSERIGEDALGAEGRLEVRGGLRRHRPWRTGYAASRADRGRVPGMARVKASSQASQRAGGRRIAIARRPSPCWPSPASWCRPRCAGPAAADPAGRVRTPAAVPIVGRRAPAAARDDRVPRGAAGRRRADPVVQSFRSCAQQRIACAEHLREPERLSRAPARRRACRGINSARRSTSRRPGSTTPRITQALEANGWCQAVPDTDPGHFSFDGCH